MISLLLPTRNRPHNLERLVESVLNTASGKTEIICYTDDDDSSYEGLELPVTFIKGPRIIMSDMWNKCADRASGDIFGLIGDDVIFRTKDWDLLVENAFKACPDKIVSVHGDDGHRKDFGTHNFIHRKWFEAVGYAMPPYFSGDMCDTWLNDVATRLGRRVYIPILTEHMHYAFGKGEFDQTHQERSDRIIRDRVGEVYYSPRMQKKRQEDVKKLRKAMK